MDLVQLKKGIKSGDIPHFLVFTGDEISLQTDYLNHIDKNYKRADDIASIWTKITNKNTLFKTAGNTTYVVRDDKDFLKNDKNWDNIDNINGTLILLLTEVDKRGKFYKKFKDIIIEFNYMTTKQLLKTVTKQVNNIGVNTNDKVTSYLIEACGNDLSTIRGAIDQLSYFNLKELTIIDIDRIIPKRLESDVFKLINNIIIKDYNKTFSELEISLLTGQSPIGILSLLSKKFETAIRLEGFEGDFKKAGLNYYQAQEVNNICFITATKAYNECQKAIKSIKIGANPEQAVWTTILKLLKY